MRVLINKKEVTYFTSGSLTLKLDSIASEFQLSFYFEPQKIEHQELFKPLQYFPIEFKNSENKLIFTGTILNHRFTSDRGRDLIILSGYSKSGILEDVTIPVSAYPLESTNRSLKNIADKLCGLFGINVVVSDQAKSISDTTVSLGNTLKEKSDFDTIKAKSESVFGRTSASPTETIKDYLAKLAGQKNIILSHNEKGDVLLFQPSYNQKPRVHFNKGNTTRISLDVNGQGQHSEINIVRQPSDENAGVSTTDSITNPLVKLYRPTTKILSSGEDTDTSEAAKNELSSELKGITCTVEAENLLDDIYPGEIVTVHHHYVYCYAYNRFMVDSIKLDFDEKTYKTTLNLVMPETFSGLPKIRNIFFNHQDEDNHIEPNLNFIGGSTNDKTIT